MLDYVETQLTRFLAECDADQVREDAITEWAIEHSDKLAVRLLDCRGWLGEQLGNDLYETAINYAQLSLTDPAEAGLQLQRSIKKHAKDKATEMLADFAYLLPRGASLCDYDARNIDLSVWQ